jgi:hypothetical protein
MYKMKKWSYLLVVAIAAGFALLLAGCGSKQAAASGNVNNPEAGMNGQPGQPLSMQLALGTLKLEGTDYTVTPEQAAELLPLWRAAKELSGADNVTPQELEGLFKQIQKAMTAEQMQAIQSMDLSGPNMAEVAKELGLELPAGGPGNLTEEQQATIEASRQSGQMPPADFGGGGGGPPPDGMPGGAGAPPGGGPQSSSSNGNQTVRQGTRRGFGTVIYQAVIDLLEKKIQ